MYFLMLASCFCAVLSKESAYCIPALAVCCLWYRRSYNSPGVKAVASLTVISVAAFLERWWAFGGIGGYRDRRGTPTILHFNPARSVDILFFRIWGVLMFPINWSIRPEMWLALGLIVFAAAVISAAMLSRPASRMILRPSHSVFLQFFPRRIWLRSMQQYSVQECFICLLLASR
jgi:hypothetical protein